MAFFEPAFLAPDSLVEAVLAEALEAVVFLPAADLLADDVPVPDLVEALEALLEAADLEPDALVWALPAVDLDSDVLEAVALAPVTLVPLATVAIFDAALPADLPVPTFAVAAFLGA